MAFKIASSPHIQQRLATSRVMALVALATVPGVFAQWYFWGWGNLIQIALAISACVLVEAACVALRGRPVLQTLNDNTALVTGLLLGICLPPLAPWYIPVLGAVFAIAIAKQVYGGIGQNLFNPAMVAYVSLLISFPAIMTYWLPAQMLAQHPLDLGQTFSVIFFGQHSIELSLEQLRLGIDGTTMATPLDSIKTDLTLGFTASEALAKPMFAQLSQQAWLWLNLAFLAGGFMLLKLKIVRWHLPVAFLSSLAICSLFDVLIDPDGSAGVWFHLTSGATMFAAFFILTDPVTAATSVRGRLVFGALIGLLVYLIRSIGGYPDAVAFAVMLANLTVPLIDHYTRPTTYGHRS